MLARRRFFGLTAALAVVLVVLGLVAAIVLNVRFEAQQRLDDVGRPAAPVADLHDVQQLADAFNQDAGTPRLVVLFSPT